MNILFIANTLVGGGAERVIARVASHLLEMGHNVYIALSDTGAVAEDKYDHDNRIEILDISSDKNSLPVRYVRSLLATLDTAKKLRTIKKEKHIDAAISFLEAPGFYNVISKTGEICITSVRNMLSRHSYSSDFKTWMWKKIDSFVGNRSDKVVCVSKNVAVEQRDLYKVAEKKLTTIYNPVNCSFIRGKSQQPTEDSSFEEFRASHEKILITAGRFVEQKAQWQMIRCLKEIKEKHPGTGLVILGKGDLEGRLEAVIKKNGLENDVYLAGFKKEPYKYLGKADVYVMTSLFEGFSNAMLEAAACGLPIVSTDCNSGPRELLAPDSDLSVQTKGIEKAEYGILCPCFSGRAVLTDDPLEPEEKLFAQAVAELLDDPEMSDHYRTKILERAGDFETEIICRQWEDLLVSLS